MSRVSPGLNERPKIPFRRSRNPESGHLATEMKTFKDGRYMTWAGWLDTPSGRKALHDGYHYIV